MIRVRIATWDDEEQLVGFLHDHWSSSHIFTKRPELFAWQHRQADGRLNMVLAEDDQRDEQVIGVLGFIPMGRFDPALGDRDLMLAIWKVRDDGVPPGVGLRLLKFLQAELQPRLIAAIGTSEMVRPIYRALRYEVGALHHAALFHPGRQGRLTVADRVPDEAFAVSAAPSSSRVEMVPLGAVPPSEIDRIAATALPTKSAGYIADRFVDHPWYHYEVRVVVMDEEPLAIVVWRRVAAEDTVVLRVVDMIGPADWVPFAGETLRSEVVAADAEYLDVTQWGLDEDAFRSAGFVCRSDHPEMILPNYFAPFERRNVDVELACRVFDGDGGPVRLFRADSDQDRPNQVDDIDAAR
ncbi:MAG: hypothetical protein RIB65_04750 [Ilumatobacter fluminis]|uniref:hypothetical protein n=1 Tax=Ilumatobacter fluminis TaxID=467091 RepID=UPI0032EB406D